MIVFLKRTWLFVVLDVLVIVAFMFPSASSVLRWILEALYTLLTLALARNLVQDRWALFIVKQPAWRVAHGLEHATLKVLAERGEPAAHGYAHGPDRFVIAFEVDHGQLDHVRLPPTTRSGACSRASIRSSFIRAVARACSSPTSRRGLC